MTKKKHDFKMISLKGKELQPETMMTYYGYDPQLSEGALKSPIFQTSTFVFKTAEEGKAFFEIAYGLREKGLKEELGLIYSRLNNPDIEILEDRLTLWDKAESCAIFNSGMAAISTTLFELLKPGDALIYSEPIYGGTDYMIRHILTSFGIKVYGFNASEPAGKAINNLIKKHNLKNSLKLIFIETPANPTNEIIDIEACSKIAKTFSQKNKEVLTIVDNTFLGPVWQQPIKQGADLVIYSATKFIGGHSDVIAGACLGSNKLIKKVKTMRTFMGNMGGPWTAWLLLRSLETLKLRMTCQMKNAAYIARFLKNHPKVEKVYYLGFLDKNKDETNYKIYKNQCLSPGSMISFDIKGGEKAAFKFLNALKIVKLAVSLGGTESLAEHPANMTHSDIAVEDQLRIGITEKMIRLSIGVENPHDLITDIEQAFG